MPAETIKEQLVKYLSDAHAIEETALAQLKTGAESVDDAALAAAFKQHLGETEEHERVIRERLESYGESPSTVKDIAQRSGAMLGGMLAKGAPDTTGKLTIQAFAFEHLEIAAYRMLRVVAERAGDEETVQVATRILGEERAAAQKIGALIERVAEGDLQRLGVAS